MLDKFSKSSASRIGEIYVIACFAMLFLLLGANISLSYSLHQRGKVIAWMAGHEYDQLQEQYKRLTPEIYSITKRECIRQGASIREIMALMKPESDMSQYAISPKWAMGFMQLMPDTARRLGVTNPFDPEQNIRAGIQHYLWCRKQAGGDVELAYMKYNGGPSRTLADMPAESIRHSRKCMSELTKSYEIALAVR